MVPPQSPNAFAKGCMSKLSISRRACSQTKWIQERSPTSLEATAVKSTLAEGRLAALAQIYDIAPYLSLSFEASCPKKRYFRRNNRKPQRRTRAGYAPWVRI